MNTSIIRKAIAGAGTLTALAAVAPASSAFVYGAINGTTADKLSSGLTEFPTGGVQNASASQRTWLMGIDLRRLRCNEGSGCTARATFRNGCATSFYLNDLGAFIHQPFTRCNTTLSTVAIGSFVTSSDTLLVRFTLEPGATPGAATSVEVTGAGVGVSNIIGTIHGRTKNFDWSNWIEHGVGGIRNQAKGVAADLFRREWLISVPSPDFDNPGARFTGGAMAPSCAIAFGVNAAGALTGSSLEKCHSTTQNGWENLPISPSSGSHVLYVLKLGGASSNGAADGGFANAVRF